MLQKGIWEVTMEDIGYVRKDSLEHGEGAGRWVKADINNLPTGDFFIRWGDGNRVVGYAPLLKYLIENEYPDVEYLDESASSPSREAVDLIAGYIRQQREPGDYQITPEKAAANYLRSKENK